MPKLLLFAPCEKVIIAHDENTVSLITVLQTLQFAVEDVGGIPEKASAPIRWFVFSMWQATPEEIGKSFEQRVELLLPDGTVGLKNDSTFTFAEGKPFHRMNIGFLKFPISKTGQCSLKLSLKNERKNTWEEYARFPMEIQHRSIAEFQGLVRA